MKDEKSFYTVVTPIDVHTSSTLSNNAQIEDIDQARSLAHSLTAEGVCHDAIIYFCVPIGRSDPVHTTVDTNFEWLARAAQALEGVHHEPGGHAIS